MITKEQAAKWAASAAAAAVLGMSLDQIGGLAVGRRAGTSGPTLHPRHRHQRPPPDFPSTAPDFQEPPDPTPLVRQTYETPPNQLILASYPNGRPGALRALQRPPPADDDEVVDAAPDDVMRVSLSRRASPHAGGAAPWEDEGLV